MCGDLVRDGAHPGPVRDVRYPRAVLGVLPASGGGGFEFRGFQADQPGHRVGLRPVALRYQLTQPPVAQTVVVMRRSG